jgi:hypothetical protein
MWQTGEYRDTKGRKVTDAAAAEAAVKAIGFQPSRIAKESRLISENMQDVRLQRKTEDAIVERFARAIVDKKPAERVAARDELRDWNRKNPILKIVIQPEQIERRVIDLRRSRSERILRATPPEMRRELRDDIRQ